MRCARKLISLSLKETRRRRMKRSIQQIIESKVHERKLAQAAEMERENLEFPIITVSRQAGSEGYLVAKMVAEKHNLNFFDEEISEAVAESAKISASEVENLDEKKISSLEDIIASVTNTHHLWSSDYLRHLRKVIKAIGKEGRAVIVGRGAHLILPKDSIIRLQFIAPLEVRIENIAKWFNQSTKEAQKLVAKIDSDREAYIKKYFNADIYDQHSYDLVINTENISNEDAVEIVDALLKRKLKDMLGD